MTGCANQGLILKPITREQKAFCSIRSLHEKGKTRKTVEKAEIFIKNYPASDFEIPVKYYLALDYVRLGKPEPGKKLFEDIIESYPASGWAELAESNLKSMED